MIDKEIVNFVSRKMKISQTDLLEKDLILSQLLFYLSKEKEFFDNYVFIGGTCLTKCHLGYYRFSEDLDFTYINQGEFEGKSQNKIRETISLKIDKVAEILEKISKTIGLRFKAEKNNRDYFQYGGGNTFVTFKLWYPSNELNKETFVKIQINHLEMIDFPPKELKVISIISKGNEKEFSVNFSEDSSILLSPITIKAYDLREILFEKIRAILTRKGVKARDFLDVYLIVNSQKINLNDFKKEILKKIEFALKYEKYTVNLRGKSLDFLDTFILGEEERLMIKEIPKGFKEFLKEFKTFLQSIISSINPAESAT